MLLVNTTSCWNVGDDLIREGVFRLLGVGPATPMIWLNRCQIHGDRPDSFIPLWQRLKGLTSPTELVAIASGYLGAGTTRWLAFNEQILRG